MLTFVIETFSANKRAATGQDFQHLTRFSTTPPPPDQDHRDISAVMDNSINVSPDPAPPTNSGTLQDSKGWDGKLRVDRKAVVTNAEMLSDPEYSDEDAPPVEQISADEGQLASAFSVFLLT